ncbi:MAG TPA: nodulation protein NfeD, partial [Gammaproteobacteria bacterium]|nr:nodulation protein NfeD [Gammaproteobacteria bacterium]
MRPTRWLFLLLLGLLSLPAIAAEKVVVLELTGAIGPASSDYLERALRQPEVQGSQAIIIRIDTPGGLDTAMRDIVQAIIGSPVPVIAYVAPGGARAASAGAYILYAANVAAMAPGTNVGAATPVQLGAPGVLEPESDGRQNEKSAPQPKNAMEQKILNDAVAYIRSLAALRGRNADWAEQAVREAASLGAAEALQRGVIDIVAADLNDLLRQLDGRTVTLGGSTLTLATADAEVLRLEPDWRTRLLAVITNPNVAYILMLIGIYGLIFELAAPGSMVPGVLGGICLLLALFAFQALPISYAGLGLVLLGLAFIAAEAFVPRFGILGRGGVISFVIGSVMLFETNTAAFRLSLGIIAGFATVSVLLLAGMVAMLL